MYFSYIKNELIKRKRRSMFVVFGIALSIAVLVSVNTLADAFMNAAQQPLQTIGTDVIIQRSGDTPEDFRGATLPCSQVIITSEEVENVEKIDGIKQMSKALLMWVFDGEDYSDSENFIIVTGFEPEQKLGPSMANEWVEEGIPIKSGDKGVALVDSIYAQQKGIKLGDDFTISGISFKAIGIIKTPADSIISTSNVYISLEDAQSMALEAVNIEGYKSGDINEIFLQADPAKLSGVIDEIGKAVPEAAVNSAESFIKAIGGIAAQSQNLAVLGSIVVLLFSLIIVAKTISGNIMERRNEIGIMKTVGWTSGDISRQIVAETFVQSVIGGIVGIGIGLLVALALGNLEISIPVSWGIDPFPHFFMTDTSEKAMNVGLPVSVSFGLVSLAFGISLIVGILSAFFTLRNINKIKPSEVLRYE